MTTLQTSLMRKIIPAAALALTVLAFAAPSPARAADIVDTAAAAPQFSTLVTAIKAAGLVHLLKGAGPFTVFAPTNAAFDKLPPSTVKALLHSPARLEAILNNHIISGKVTAKQVMSMKSSASPLTLEGIKLHLTTHDGTIMVDGAKMTKSDIMADNGVIHPIDTVLVPSGMLNHGETGQMQVNDAISKAIDKAVKEKQNKSVVAGHKKYRNR